MYIMKYIYWYLSISSTLIITNALPGTPGIVPIPGKAVYIKESNSLWSFSFGKSSPADNKLSYVDLNQSFNTLNPPVIDLSTRISGDQCPVMHFAQAFLGADGVSVNIFGAGSDINNVYEPTMTICQYNTKTDTWKEIKPSNGALARRNAAIEFSPYSNMTYFFGGSSEVITGLPASSPNYPNYWPQGVSMFDAGRDTWIGTEPQYTNRTRANATMTQIRDTNGQLVILGGTVINNISNVDMVTNFPLANMSDVIVLDPRTSVWSNIKTVGNTFPIARKHHTTTLHPDGHTLIVIGGETFNQTGAYMLNDVWTLDTRVMNNYQWSQPPIQGNGLYRSNHTSILIGDQIWVIAGTNLTNKAVDIQLLNVTNWTWSYNAVSNYVPPPELYANIGGIKGLIGIIVGVVGGLLLFASCAAIWWCRRRRIKPTNKNQQLPAVPSASMAYYGGSDGSYQDSYQIHQQNQHQQMYNDYPQQPDMSTIANSKTNSRPSMSTTTSHNNVISDWSNQHPTITNSFTAIRPPNINTNNYYAPQLYTNGPPPPMTPASPPIDQNQFYNENYYTDSNNNVYNQNEFGGAIPGYTSTAAGAAVHSGDGNPRHSFNYWDAPPRFSSDAANLQASAADNSYFLTPVGQTNDNLPRSSARAQTSQQLQKPNEVDTNPVTSPETSTTVCTNSTVATTATPAYDTINRDTTGDQV